MHDVFMHAYIRRQFLRLARGTSCTLGAFRKTQRGFLIRVLMSVLPHVGAGSGVHHRVRLALPPWRPHASV